MHSLPTGICIHLLFILPNERGGVTSELIAQPTLHINIATKYYLLTANETSLPFIFMTRSYETTVVEGNTVKPSTTKMQFKTERKVGKTGVMLVGLGGNNGW